MAPNSYRAMGFNPPRRIVQSNQIITDFIVAFLHFFVDNSYYKRG